MTIELSAVHGEGVTLLRSTLLSGNSEVADLHTINDAVYRQSTRMAWDIDFVAVADWSGFGIYLTL